MVPVHGNSVLINIMSRNCHKYHFRPDKHAFVTTKHIFCHDKSMLVTTNKCFVMTKLAVASILLLRRKTCFVMKNTHLS